MNSLVQIIYISRSSAAPAKRGKEVDPVVARILAKSRANNRKNGLVGVLYFGDGCFFQCLEGEEEAINTLYAKLEQDPRHRDLKIISRVEIAEPTFKDWSMKYVPAEHEMAALLQRRGLTSFDPYRLDAGGIAEVIALLHSALEPAPAVLVSAPEAAPAATPRRAAQPSRQLAIWGALVLAATGALWWSLGG